MLGASITKVAKVCHVSRDTVWKIYITYRNSGKYWLSHNADEVGQECEYMVSEDDWDEN